MPSDYQQRTLLMSWKPRFNLSKFKAEILDLIIMKQLSFSIVESEYFNNAFKSVNPIVVALIPKDGDTVKAWIQRKYEPVKADIIVLLSESCSTIHLAVDIWTSFNALAILGIVAHWMKGDGSRRSSLLGLLQMKARHDGEHISEEMISVIELFELVHKLGYFITDNVTNNNRAICILGQKYGFDLDE
jgi:hypothetical protein